MVRNKETDSGPPVRSLFFPHNPGGVPKREYRTKWARPQNGAYMNRGPVVFRKQVEPWPWKRRRPGLPTATSQATGGNDNSRHLVKLSWVEKRNVTSG
jgi:hypothetical protein